MTVQAQVSGQTQVSVFIPRDYDVFAGLDVDHHSIATTFTDHGRLLRSLRLPYWNRASRSRSVKSASGKTLIATSRLSLVSRALYTSPIPPAPTGATIS
jgi:hypothetical protein